MLLFIPFLVIPGVGFAAIATILPLRVAFKVPPTLVVSGKPLSQGKVPSVSEIVQMLTTYLATHTQS